jgi:hypothetical protein
MGSGDSRSTRSAHSTHPRAAAKMADGQQHLLSPEQLTQFDDDG